MTEDRAAVVQRVKQANDIVDVVSSYVALRPAGGTFKGLCPFHDDNRPSFDVDPRRQRYRCWSCGKYGDVISFVQEQERVDFREALELLARRAGISLENRGAAQHNQGRALMLDVMRWAAEQFQLCLLDDESPEAQAARLYLGERRLTGETVRRFGVGYAPPTGQWLVERATAASLSLDLLEKVGLIARRDSGGCYDRFRDRVMFPIRDIRGQTVGFGGRIMPASPLVARVPKYYNSCETPLFNKSEQVYGLDLAREPAGKVGFLAVVEGYTDVLMAHQLGVGNVVATMGTALNASHVRQLRRFSPRVVLVYDADEGGDTGVDRALEIFVSQDIDLRIATLPEGLDPCDLLIRDGAESFKAALTKAVDVLEFKLNRVLAAGVSSGVEGQRQAVEATLGVIARGADLACKQPGLPAIETILDRIALAPPLPGQAGAVKQELMITRIAHRLGLKEETVWARLKELRTARRGAERTTPARDVPKGSGAASRSAPASRLERELLAILLAEPALVPVAVADVSPRDVEHPGLRQLVEGLYRLHAEGVAPEFDRLRPRIENQALMAKALELQEEGLMNPDRAKWLTAVLAGFRARRSLPEKQELQTQLQAALGAGDQARAQELLQRLQNLTGG
ncbi:MAG TPA: DNA primase [Gemmataceae bacterium]|nr:DNA primase [Gemmataceae bacterium]